MRVDWSLILSALGTLLGAGALSKILWPHLWGRSIRAETDKKEAEVISEKIRQSTLLAETAMNITTELTAQQKTNMESIGRLESMNSELSVLVAKQAHELMEVRHLQLECEAGKHELSGKLLAAEQEMVTRQREIDSMRDRIGVLEEQVRAPLGAYVGKERREC